MVERLLTVNMRRYLVRQHRSKRVRKAAGYVRDRVAHYTKTDIGSVTLSRELNNSIVKRYAKSMEPIRVKVSLDKGTAKADLFRESAPQQPKPAEAKPRQQPKPRQDASPAEKRQPARKPAAQAK